MRLRKHFQALSVSLHEALTTFRGIRHLHCKAPEEYNTSLQGEWSFISRIYGAYTIRAG